MTVTLARGKALALQHAYQVLLNTAHPTIREVACVLGKIVSSFPGVMYVALHYHNMQDIISFSIILTCIYVCLSSLTIIIS